MGYSITEREGEKQFVFTCTKCSQETDYGNKATVHTYSLTGESGIYQLVVCLYIGINLSREIVLFAYMHLLFSVGFNSLSLCLL